MINDQATFFVCVVYVSICVFVLCGVVWVLCGCVLWASVGEKYRERTRDIWGRAGYMLLLANIGRVASAERLQQSKCDFIGGTVSVRLVLVLGTGAFGGMGHGACTSVQ